MNAISQDTLSESSVRERIETLRREYSGKRLTNFLVAVVITVIWTLAVLILIVLGAEGIITVDQEKFRLNLVGDFLAGFSSLLAVVWFVFAYRQQSLEIAQNTEALIAQLEEVSESVKQQTQQARAQDRQADLIELNERHSRRDIVFRTSDFYISNISTLLSYVLKYCFDFKAQALSGLWQQYADGDKTIFAATIFSECGQDQEKLKYFLNLDHMQNYSSRALRLEARRRALTQCVNLYDEFIGTIRELGESENIIRLYSSGPFGDLVDFFRIYNSTMPIK